MRGASTAGVELDPLVWLAEMASAGYRTGFIATMAHIAVRCDRKTLRGTLKVSEIARRAKQDRADVREHLVLAAADGWLDLGAAATGGRNAKRELFLTRPALLSVTRTGSDRDQLTRVTGSDRDQLTRVTGSDRDQFHPPTPPPGGNGKENLPLPTSPEPGHVQSPLVASLTGGGLGGLTADERTEAGVVLEMLPRRLWPKSPGWRSRMLELIAGLLNQGWTAAEIKTRAAEDLPGDVIRYPVSFVEKRFEGLTPPRRDEAAPAGKTEYCPKPEHYLSPLPCRGCRAEAIERRAEAG